MKAKSVKKNYIYNLIYQILLVILPLITTPYVSRVLSPEGVGQSSFVSSLITYFIIFANFGFGYYAQRIMAKTRDDKYNRSKVFYEIFIIRFIFVLISIIINVLLVKLGIYGNNSILMFISTINIIAVLFDISFFFQGNEDFGILIIKNLITRFIGIIAIFVFVKNSGDVSKYVLINSLVTILGNVFMWLSLKGNICKINLKQLTPFIHFLPSLKLFIPTIAISVYTILDKSLIGIITQNNAQNGYYEQADKLVKLVMTVVTSLSAVMISRNSYEIEKGNLQVVKDNCYKSIHIIWLIGIPVMVGICLISSNLVPWLFGAGYQPVIKLIYILSFLNIAIGLSGVLGLQYIIPLGKDNLFTVCITTGALTNLILNIPLIIYFGAVGAAIATIIAESIITVVMMIKLRKELKFKNIFKTSLKPIIAAIIMVIFTLPFALLLDSSILNTLIIICAGILSYGLSILLLKDKIVIELFSVLKQRFLKRKKIANLEFSQKHINIEKKEELEINEESLEKNKSNKNDV